MLSPLVAAVAVSSATDGAGAVAVFMSGSGSAAGDTTLGSSPGCQRSMLSAEAPSDELPKNRLAVFTEKPSRDGVASASAAAFWSSSGWASGGIATSYWASGGALSAA